VNDVEPTYPVPGLYSIDEVAQQTGVGPHTLRYYERIGLLDPVGRASSGHRRYRREDIGAVEFLTLLRQTGMPIREMQHFVELTRQGEHTIADRVVALEAHREALAAQLALLTGHYAAIEHKISIYRALLENGSAPSAPRTEIREYA
jgi:DNA-binding transcriptional MerR regulator